MDDDVARLAKRVSELEIHTKQNTTRITNTARRVEQVKTQVKKLEDDILLNTRITADVSAKLSANTKITEEVRDNTAAVVTIVNALSGTVQVLEWVAKPVKTLMILGAMYTAFRLWMVDHLPVWLAAFFRVVK